MSEGVWVRPPGTPPKPSKWHMIATEDAWHEVGDDLYYCPECDERQDDDSTKCARYPKEHGGEGYMNLLGWTGLRVELADPDAEWPEWALMARDLADEAGLEFECGKAAGEPAEGEDDNGCDDTGSSAIRAGTAASEGETRGGTEGAPGPDGERTVAHP